MFTMSTLIILCIAVSILIYSYIVGYPYATKISRHAAFELSFTLGIAILAVVALLVNTIFNVGVAQTFLVFLLPLGFSIGFFRPPFDFYIQGLRKRSSLWLPALMAFIAAAGVFIKINGTEIAISSPLFDHIKIAVINSFVREGFPLKNPFIVDPSAGDLFHYYYLFYLLAANIAILFHCSALNADIVLTFITAFISILICFYLARELFNNSNKNKKYFYLICLFLFSGSTVVVVNQITQGYLGKILITPLYHPMESWLYQAAWIPQHLLSAVFSICALFFLGRKETENQYGFWLITFLIAAGFGSSVWVGGVTFIVIAFLIFFDQLCIRKDKRKVMVRWIKIAVVSFCFSFPIFYNAIAAPTQKSIFPLRFAVYDTSVYSHGIDILFFFVGAMPVWLTVLTIGFYAVIYTIIVQKVKINQSCKVLLLICLGSLLTSLLIQSRINNNDLGWRAILLFIFSATALISYYFINFFSFSLKCCLILLAFIGMIEPLRFSQELIYGRKFFVPKPELKALKQIDSITNKKDRLLVNVHQNEENEPWGGNLLPPLFINRFFCFQNMSYGSTFAPNWGKEIFQMDKAIRRFYNGQADKNDIALIYHFHCNKIIVTHDDPIWQKKPYDGLKLIYSDQKRKIFTFDAFILKDLK